MRAIAHAGDGVAHGHQHLDQRARQPAARLASQADRSMRPSMRPARDDALQLRRLAGRAAQDGGQEDQHRRLHHHIGRVNEHGRQLRTGEAHHAIAPFLQIVEAQVVHRRHAGRHHDRFPVAIRQQECQIHKNPEMQLGQAGRLMDIQAANTITPAATAQRVSTDPGGR
jgi:hypothetical protein